MENQYFKIGKHSLAISLIKDDLINTKLNSGLNALELNTKNYVIHLSDTILKLMCIEDSEENESVFEHYLELSEEVMSLDISESHQQVELLALKIYNELNSYRLRSGKSKIPP